MGKNGRGVESTKEFRSKSVGREMTEEHIVLISDMIVSRTGTAPHHQYIFHGATYSTVTEPCLMREDFNFLHSTLNQTFSSSLPI